MLYRLQFWINEAGKPRVSVNTNGRFDLRIIGYGRQSLYRVAVQAVQKPSYISVDLMFAAFDLAARSFSALLEALYPFRH